jgi:hypothetical protein
MKECPNCAVEVPGDSVTCRICGYEFPRRKALPWKPVAVLLLVAILIPLVRALLRLLRG